MKLSHFFWDTLCKWKILQNYFSLRKVKNSSCLSRGQSSSRFHISKDIFYSDSFTTEQGLLLQNAQKAIDSI